MPDETWDYKFRTPVIETEISDLRGSKFVATVSTRSREMIIGHDIDILHVFVVDLDTIDLGKPLVRHLETDYCGCGFDPLHILEDGEYLAIVIESKNAVNQLVYCCACRYKLSSKELTTDDTEMVLDRFYWRNDHHFDNAPCFYSQNISDNKNVWMFEGNVFDGSSLKSLSFEGKDGLVLCSHPPPPFSCVSGMTAGKIKRDCLANLKPITRYMHDEVKGYIPIEREYVPSD